MVRAPILEHNWIIHLAHTTLLCLGFILILIETYPSFKSYTIHLI